MWIVDKASVRRIVGTFVCGSMVLSLGCAGSPLRLRRKGPDLAGVNSTESVVQTNASATNQSNAAGVVTIDSLGAQPTAQAQRQPAAAPQQRVAQTAAPTIKPRKNFASIFETGPKENQLADPFLNSPEPKRQQPVAVQKPPAATQTAQAPATADVRLPSSTNRVKLESGFDSAMAELAPKSTSNAQTATVASTEFNPFAALTETKPVAPSVTLDTKATEKQAEAKLAELQNELAAALENSNEVAKSAKTVTEAATSNPFAAFVAPTTSGETATARSTTTPALPEKDQTADWVKGAVAGIAASSSSKTDEPSEADPQPQTVADTEIQSRPAGSTASLEAAARERVRQLLDASELALRGDRFDDAEAIASQAYRIVEDENLTFSLRERTPTTLLRRIASAKRLATESADSQDLFVADSIPVEEPIVAPREEQPAVAKTEAAETSTDAFGDFPAAAMWQAVSNPNDDFATPKPTSADEIEAEFAVFTSSPQIANAPGPPAEEATTPTTTDPSWTAPDGVKYQPASFSEAADDPVEPVMSTLSAPSWPSDDADESAGGSTPAPPAWPTTTASPSDTAELPKLPSLGSMEAGSASEQWTAPDWATEEHDQVAMATVEIAPPPPVVADASPVPEQSINYGNILALLTVIGLGLVAVIAFRTRPEEL